MVRCGISKREGLTVLHGLAWLWGGENEGATGANLTCVLGSMSLEGRLPAALTL